MKGKPLEPKKSADGKRVYVEIDVEGHRLLAAFVRLPDGNVGPPAMHGAELSESPRKAAIEAAFWDAAKQFRREKLAMLDSTLAASTDIDDEEVELPPKKR
jgi:hypothetical protein